MGAKGNGEGALRGDKSEGPGEERGGPKKVGDPERR